MTVCAVQQAEKLELDSILLESIQSENKNEK